jgi:S-adenosylmethionine decarboxylase
MIKKTKGSVKWIKKEDNLENIGVHLIVEFWGGKQIEDPKKFESFLLGAAKAAKATALKVNTHKFKPHGVTGVVLLSESHITFHTWPELKYLALDIFTCGKKCKPYAALEYLKEQIKPKHVQVMEIKRGVV